MKSFKQKPVIKCQFFLVTSCHCVLPNNKWRGQHRKTNLSSPTRLVRAHRKKKASLALFCNSNFANASLLGDGLECAVCLQNCIHPVQLPCGHIFCFLCVKGITNQSNKCAMCRQEIPCDFIEHPNLLQTPPQENAEGFDGGYQWFYEGRNGEF